MKSVTDRLAPLVGFITRVTERGGTPLSSLLSNKNPWSGQACGRGKDECFPCQQETEIKEPCTLRNILYESECGSCNELGTSKLRDKDSLCDSRNPPSIYVGESARSVAERSKEHWGDYKKGKEETHMYTHWKQAHGNEDPPVFNFKVVKSFKSALARQVAEAVRIQQRGAVLNIKGVYNRSKLTRLVVDSDWEEKVWADSWKETEDDEGGREVDDEGLSEPRKKRREGGYNPTAKRRKIMQTPGPINNFISTKTIPISSKVPDKDNVKSIRKNSTEQGHPLTHWLSRKDSARKHEVVLKTN